MEIRIKRVYLTPAKTDGYRVLVDRIWPRGLSREQAALDLWVQEVAPSTTLRKWFGHDPGKWAEFKRRYADELHAHPEAVQALLGLLKSKSTVTLLFGAKDEAHNQAVVLKDHLERLLAR